MNRIRIAEVKLDAGFAYVRGDAAAAYEPELGVLRFDRHFLFTAPDGFAIWDDLAAKEPRTFTSLLHADERIEALGKNSYIVKNHNARLRATVAAPEDAQARIEPNVVTAAGQPGSVDKGERQERGLRLAISTGAPATSARLVMLLKIEDEE